MFFRCFSYLHHNLLKLPYLKISVGYHLNQEKKTKFASDVYGVPFKKMVSSKLIFQIGNLFAHFLLVHQSLLKLGFQVPVKAPE